MKSLLLEASTVDRAIDKAWNEAGKPKEFTIKVHDEGERNFFGMSRRPAAVSIIYVPKREDRSSRRSQDRRSNNNRSSEQKQSRNNQSQKKSEESRSGAWKSDWKEYVVGNVREIVRLMEIVVPFDVDCSDKVLTITFKRNLLEDAEEQRLFFASLSYLSIQFLKRQFRSRFVGFRIVVASLDKPVSGSFAKKKKDTEKNASSSRSQSRSQGEPRERRRRNNKPMGLKKSENRASLDDEVRRSIEEEQKRFAQAQMDLEQAHRAAQEIDSAPVKDSKPAVEQTAAPERPEKKEAPVEKQAESRSEEKSEKKERPSAASKKKPKYRAFYVLPDEEQK